MRSDSDQFGSLRFESELVRIAEIAVGEAVDKTKAGDAAKDGCHLGNADDRYSTIESKLRDLDSK